MLADHTPVSFDERHAGPLPIEDIED